MSKKTEEAAFDVSAESLLELRAQVQRKQQEAMSSRAKQGGVTKRPVAGKGKGKGKGKREKGSLPTRQTMTLDEADEWARSREALERKARLYELMERGDLDAAQVAGAKGAILVDFDRKGWDPERREYVGPAPKGDPDEPSPFEQLARMHAQRGAEQEKEKEKVEYLDEFGRTRMVTPAEKARLEAEQDRAAHREDDAYDYSSHAGPSHFDADWEIRTKGIGFFKFSRDEPERQRQMQDLSALRKSTVEERARVEQQRRQMDALSGLIAERKRQSNQDP